MIDLIIAMVMFTFVFSGEALFSSNQNSSHSNINSPIPGEFIVVLNSPSQHALYESSAPLPYSSTFTIGKMFQAYLYKNVNASTLAILHKHPYVDYVEANSMVYATDVQKSPPSWGLKRVSKRILPFEDEYVYPSSAGKGARVYIIDTGIYLQHKDFGGRAEFGVTINSDGGDADCNGHGTHVAGTVGGTQYGVAKLSTLIHVKVLGCGGSGSFADIIAGIDWAVKDNAGRAGTEITTGVINLSLGGGVSQAVNDAVDAAFAGGILSVVAAGNDNFADACTKSPASAKTAFTIAAADINDEPASFTNLGSCVNIWAPGVSIDSTWIGSDTATRTLSGTSMAAPHVAGVAALLLAKSVGTSPNELATEITTLTTPDQINYKENARGHTFSNESRISHPSFLKNECETSGDCSTARTCCIGLKDNVCCGPATSCCPGQLGNAHCGRISQECCGDTTCSRGSICCPNAFGDFCCPAGSICLEDRTCYNPLWENTPNRNLFNGLD